MIGVGHAPATKEFDEPLLGAKQNISRRQLELKIQSKTKGWAYDVQLPAYSVGRTNDSASSFETYQQEHKKWFGVRRRGTPVNNFDIDWEQMRRKLEIQELTVWQKQKGVNKFDGKELRKYWDIDSQSKSPTEATTSTSRVYKSSFETPHDTSQKPNILFDEAYRPEFKKYKARPFYKNYNSDVNSMDLDANHMQDESLEPPFGKVDKDGKTAFGRLYEEPKKRHYRVFDNRDMFFDEKDIKTLINNTYNADFRIMTHRKTQWHNRTFDPNYIFTQSLPGRIRSKPKYTSAQTNTLRYDKYSAAIPVILNDSQTVDPDFNNYLNVLKENRFMSLRPKHQSFKDKHNNTIIINQENDTFILQRSKRIPWDNKTDLDIYQAYRRSRKKFYNKTIDIVFSYYIFHKFKCGNSTRDLGYGRMSNVVNRWYNRTFVPKYRPDMFYVHNRCKAGKELNFFKNEFNIVHSMMSEGKFDPNKWGHVLMISNHSKGSRVSKPERNQTFKTNKEVFNQYNSFIPNRHLPHAPAGQFSKEMSTRPPKTMFPFKRNVVLKVTTFKWKKASAYITPSPSTQIPYTSITRKSFFKVVKETGFGFFKSLFGKPSSKKNEE